MPATPPHIAPLPGVEPSSVSPHRQRHGAGIGLPAFAAGSGVGLSGAVLPPPGGQAGGSRLAEEQSCLRTILLWLDTALRQHSAPMLPGQNLPSHGAASLEEAAEYFELILSLLAADSNPLRVKTLVFDTQPSCIDLFIGALRVPAPPHQIGHAPYEHCRVLCIQTLTKVLSMCTGGGAADTAAQIAVPATLPARCLSALDANGFIPFALAHLAPATTPAGAAVAPLGTNEAVRIALSECLFVLVMRVDGAAAAVAGGGGAAALCETLFADPSVMVRNYTCAVLRVLAERASESFGSVVITDRALMLIKSEHSRYVVILLFEIVALLFAAHPHHYLDRCSEEQRAELFRVARTFLAGNANQEVLAAVVRLVEAVCTIEARTAGQHSGFVRSMLSQDGWKPLLTTDAEHPPALRVLKLRALRHVAECSMAAQLADHLHDAFTHFVPSLVLLLRGGTDLPSASPEMDVELALCIGVILAADPRSRAYLRDTVGAFPVRMAELRQKLVAAAEAPAQVMNGVFIVDVGGRWLNDPRALPAAVWGDRSTLAAAVADLFSEQERRGRARVADTCSLREEDSLAAGPGGVLLRDLKATLTHAVLLHALHATLTPTDAPPPPVPMSLPLRMEEPPPAAEVPAAHYETPDRTPGPPLPEAAAARTPPRRSESTSRGRPSRTGRSASRALSPSVKRPAWNSGGNAFRRGLFSSPSSGPRRTCFTPGRSPRQHRDRSDDQDYVDLAIMMFLPITFGAHYNKRNKPLVRRFSTGGAPPYVQQMQRSTTLQSWEVKDLRQGDLFAFYIPCNKIGEDRITAEIHRLHRHITKMKKGFLTTPHTQKGLRWFFHDMQHYVLPKVETLLADLRDLVSVHGAQNIAFYLNIIRLTDDGKQQQRLAAGDSPDMPAGAAALLLSDGDRHSGREHLLRDEVLTLSRGKYRDVIHSGNIVYVLEKLKEYFRENFARGEVQVPDHLKDIEAEIRLLEEKAARDVPGNEREAEAEDDVESEYDSSDTADMVVPGVSAQHQAAVDYADLDNPGRLDDADFSTETQSDVAQNLERMRLTGDDAGGGVPYGGAAAAAEDPKLSPPRRPRFDAPPGSDEWVRQQQQQQQRQHDDWASDSTISF